MSSKLETVSIPLSSCFWFVFSAHLEIHWHFNFLFSQLKADVAELYRLSELTDRRRIKDILSIEAKKLETEISHLQSSGAATKSNPSSSAPVKRCFDVRLTSYGSSLIYSGWVTWERIIFNWFYVPILRLGPNRFDCEDFHYIGKSWNSASWEYHL